MPKTETQWRFFWPHADDKSMGACWRSEKPSPVEQAEWREDFGGRAEQYHGGRIWMERREVTYSDPVRVELEEG